MDRAFFEHLVTLVDPSSSCCSLGQSCKQASSSQYPYVVHALSVLQSIGVNAQLLLSQSPCHSKEKSQGLLHLNLYMRLHLGSNVCFNARLSLSLSVFLTRERSTYIVFMLAAAAAEAIEVGAAPRSPPQSACLECCSACSEYRSACCSPTRPKTVWTPFKNFVSVILKLVEFVLPTPNGKCNNAQQTVILLCLSLITVFVKLMP